MNADNGGFGFAGGLQAQPPQSAPASGAALVKDTTTAGFQADVLQESRSQPVLVDFWAPWCGPCRQLGPVLEKAVQAARGRVKLVKMNIDDHPAIPGQLGIQSIPAVIAFKDGQPVDGFMGAIPESQVKAFIDKVSSGAGGSAQIEEALAAADQARGAGDRDAAMDIYSAVLEHDAENVPALAALADMLLEAGDAKGAEQVLDRAPATKANDPALAAVRAKIKLASQVAELGDPAELGRRLAVDPEDHQARFDLAMIENARGDRMAAAENLLAIVKADRGWKDDAARNQLLTFFEAWGAADEVTLAARRKLSSILFS